MFILSQNLYRKLTCGVIALPVIMFWFCRIEYPLNGNNTWVTSTQILLALLFIGCFIWTLYFAYKVATLEKNVWQLVFIILLAFGPMTGAILGGSDNPLVFAYSVTLLIVHLLIAWPICFYWAIHLLFAKPDPEIM